MRCLRWTPALVLLAACGGTSLGAQAPRPPAPDDPARPFIYEVPLEQVAPAQAAPFLEVSGSATVSVPPDRAQASFAVETQAKSAAEAAGQNAERMAAVIAALQGSGVQGITVETFGYTLRPDYRYDPNSGQSQTIDGYTASNNVRATTRDVTAVGRLIDFAIGAGANRVSSLGFEASNTDAARAEALRLAVGRARSEAEAIATALGVELGAALEVHGGAQAPGPRPMMDVAFRMAEAVPTPIEAAGQEVQANVTIRFALGAAGSR